MKFSRTLSICKQTLNTTKKAITCSFTPNPKQKDYIRYLDRKENSLVLGVGPAGTGKTMFACKVGMEQLLDNRVKKLIITRPIVPIGNEMGYLPGTLEDKMDPWLIPIYDSMKHTVTSNTLNQMLRNETFRAKSDTISHIEIALTAILPHSTGCLTLKCPF